jgi:uncharacterized protein (TIRG00374 family)
MNRHLKTLIKVAVTVTGLYIAYRQMDLAMVTEIITTYDYRYLLAGILLNCFGVILLAARLRVAFDSKESLWSMAKINFVAAFFNLFLPSTIGGDTIKVTKLAATEKSTQRSLAKVFADRFYGVISILMISIVSLLLLKHLGTEINQYILYSVYIMIAGTVTVAFLIQTGLLVKMLNYIPSINIFGFKKTFHLENFGKAIDELKQFPLSKRAKLIAISIIYQLNSALISYVGLLSFGINIGFLYIVFFSSLSAVLLMIPISIGGLGTRELIYKGLFGTVTDSLKVVLLALMDS